MLVRSPARLSRATACSCARRTRVRTGQRTRATATFPSGAALRVSRAACIMQRRARGCAALHCAPRLASVLLAIRSAVSCCHARECKGVPREAVARAKAFRKTPSRCGSRHAAPSTRMRSHVRVWVQVNLLPPGSASHRAHRQGSLPSRARPCRQLGVAREYADTPPIHTTHTRIL